MSTRHKKKVEGVPKCSKCHEEGATEYYEFFTGDEWSRSTGRLVGVTEITRYKIDAAPPVIVPLCHKCVEFERKVHRDWSAMCMAFFVIIGLALFLLSYFPYWRWAPFSWWEEAWRCLAIVLRVSTAIMGLVALYHFCRIFRSENSVGLQFAMELFRTGRLPEKPDPPWGRGYKCFTRAEVEAIKGLPST